MSERKNPETFQRFSTDKQVRETRYIVKRREFDGAICIYTAKYNVVIAEFANGASVDAEIISAQLNTFYATQTAKLQEGGK